MELSGSLEKAVKDVSGKAVAACAEDLAKGLSAPGLEALEETAGKLMRAELEGEIFTSQVGGFATLVGEASAPIIAGAMGKDGRDDAFVANWSALRGITGAASGVARGGMGAMSADSVGGVAKNVVTTGAALGGRRRGDRQRRRSGRGSREVGP